jgi:branched-chain amino acid transport system ATP-binding protein
MMKLDGVNAGYGKHQVLFDLSIQFRSSEIHVVVGPNGSGKSTLLRSIFGLTTVYSGQITFDGVNITGLQPHQIAKLGVAYLPQTDNVFANLKVHENLKMAVYTVRDESQRRIASVLQTFPLLESRLQSRAHTLSGGERQMLAMAMALTRRPKTMLFDEPTANLAPLMARKILDQIIHLSRELSITSIVVEQNARRALEIGDTAHLLVGGRIVFQGSCQELLQQKELGKLYLGIT